MKRILAVGLFTVLLILAIFGHSLATTDPSYTINSSYKVSADGIATVSNTFSVAGASDGTKPTSLKVPIAGREPSSISAKVNDKTTSAKITEGNASITVEIPNTVSVKDGWKLVLTYKSSVLKKLGSVDGLEVPSFEGIGLNIASQKTVVSADLELGLATAMPSPTKTDIATGEQIFTYDSKTGPVGDTITLVFNDETSAIVSLSSVVKNDGWWWKTVELTLPPDTNQQQVILNSMEPAPSNVRLDQDGNILAQYNLGPKKSLNVSAKLVANVRNINYDLDSDKTLNDISPAIKELYTRQTDKWHGNNLEIDVNPVAPVTEIAETIYDAVVAKGKSESALTNNSEFNGTNMDDEGTYANMLIGELRANGVPARAVLGKLVSDGQFILDESRNHTWVETYIPDIGWVTMDPAFAIYGDYYGTGDVMHVGLALWGVSDDLPPIDLNKIAVKYSEELVEVPKNQPTVTATKMMVLPGVSIMNVNVDMPAGVITDGNAVEYLGVLYQLGSLAPLQKTQTRSFAFGAKSIGSEEVTYGYSDGEVMTTEIVKVNSSTSYVLMIAILVALIVLIVVIFWLRKRKTSKKYKPSKDSLIMHDEDDGGEVENIDMVGEEQLEDIPAPPPESNVPPAPINKKPATVNQPQSHDTINSSNKGAGFQGSKPGNPRRHIIQ